MDIRPIWRGTPNYTEGRKGFTPEAIVIHIIEGSLASARSWFLADQSDVSAHYAVGKDGACDQFVDETDTAWANGRVASPTWPLLKPRINPNLYTLSIEHEGRPGDVWTPAMKKRSAMLIAEMHVRWSIPIDGDHVIGHFRIFAQKPQCPGSQSIVDELILMAQTRLK